MRKIIGKFIVNESSVENAYPQRKAEDVSNDDKVSIFDVCLRDENNNDLLLINSSTGRCLLIRSNVSLNVASKGYYGDQKTR